MYKICMCLTKGYRLKSAEGKGTGAVVQKEPTRLPVVFFFWRPYRQLLILPTTKQYGNVNHEQSVANQGIQALVFRVFTGLQQNIILTIQ